MPIGELSLRQENSLVWPLKEQRCETLHLLDLLGGLDIGQIASAYSLVKYIKSLIDTVHGGCEG